MTESFDTAADALAHPDPFPQKPDLVEPQPGNEAGTDPASKEPEVENAWFRENLEAVVIAIIMALVLRHFCVEAFKIPTPSMEPTLIGRPVDGDRILVNKFAYLMSDPERWDVIVFKYPLNITKNYIKRLVGLPGETISIRDGDVFINDKISRKPRHVQEILWKNWPWFLWRETDNVFFKEWRLETDERERWKLENGSLTVDTPGLTRAFLGKRVMDSYRSLNQHYTSPTSDVRLAMTVTPSSSAKEVILSIRANNRTAELLLATAGSGQTSKLTFDGKILADLPPLTLTPGVSTELVYCHVDDTLLLDVNGEEAFRHEYVAIDEGGGRFQKGKNEIGFGVTQGQVSFKNISLHRDIHYTFEARDTWNRTPGDLEYPTWTIPEGHYFVLGDNSPQSKDCRYWGVRDRTLGNGRVIHGDANPRTEILEGLQDPNTFVDCFGEAYTLDSFDHSVKLDEEEPMSFVPERYLMGKAFFVFWPLFRSKVDLEKYRATGPSGDDSSTLNVRFVR